MEPEVKEKPKQKREFAKLDAERLLSEKGLPRLLEMTKQIEFTNTYKDLDLIMKLYQLWGHDLFPKLPLRDFIEKAEKTCREKRMKVYYLRETLDLERRRNMGIYAEQHYNPWQNVQDSDEEDMIPESVVEDPLAEALFGVSEIVRPTQASNAGLRQSQTMQATDGQLNTLQAADGQANEEAIDPELLRQAEINRQKALENLARRQQEKLEEQRKRDLEDENMGRFIAENYDLFTD